jgi:putative ABC transport system permease protein
MGVSAVGIPMPPPPNADVGYTAQIRIVPSVVVTSFLVGVLATLIAFIAPAVRVARGDIADQLRQGI